MRPISADSWKLLPEKFDGHHAAPRGRGAARQLHDAGLHRAAAASSRCRPCSPTTRPIRASPTSPAISSMRGCSRARTRSRPPIRRRQLDAWAERAADLGEGRRAEGPAARRRDAEDEGQAARRVRLRHPRGQGARAGRGDGADRAAGSSNGDARTLFTIGYEKAKPDAVLASSSAPRSSSWSTPARSRPRAGRAFPSASSPRRSTSTASRYLHLQKLGTPAEGRAGGARAATSRRSGASTAST